MRKEWRFSQDSAPLPEAHKAVRLCFCPVAFFVASNDDIIRFVCLTRAWMVRVCTTVGVCDQVHVSSRVLSAKECRRAIEQAEGHAAALPTGWSTARHVGKNDVLFVRFYIKMIILPKQARDRHRKNSKMRVAFFLAYPTTDLAVGR
jgi:hypothetical protein